MNKIIKNKPTYVRSHVQHQSIILMLLIYNFIILYGILFHKSNIYSLFNVVLSHINPQTKISHVK